MFGMTSSFASTTLVLVIILVLVGVFFHFKSKRDKLSAFDKSLQRLWLFTFFIVALMFTAMLYLPPAFYRIIDPSAGLENVSRDLILNQQQMGDDLRQFQQILTVVLMMSGFYLATVGTLIRRLYRERQRKELLEDPQLKKPLGLETS